MYNSVIGHDDVARVVPRTVVAIPVCNEQARIGACLEAFAKQDGLEPGSLGIVLFLNNCTDRTADVVRDVHVPWPIRVIVQDDSKASAGWARRIAMNAAADWLSESPESDTTLLTTDADSRVPPDWVALNLLAIARGAHAVAGRVSLDADEAAALPPALHARGALEAQYEALLTEIGALLDPEPGNAWPCHWSKSGATLAVRLSTYRLVGGMPDRTQGEDRAFVDAILARDLMVRHAPEIEVITSGRLEGRASGGVADTIKLRCEEPNSPCDDRLERLDRAIARFLWRRRLRHLHSQGRLSDTALWAPFLGIPKWSAHSMVEGPFFGEAYASIERVSPRLAYHPVRPSDLPRQIRLAELTVAVLRTFAGLRCVKRPVGIQTSEPDTALVPTQLKRS